MQSNIYEVSGAQPRPEGPSSPNAACRDRYQQHMQANMSEVRGAEPGCPSSPNTASRDRYRQQFDCNNVIGEVQVADARSNGPSSPNAACRDRYREQMQSP